MIITKTKEGNSLTVALEGRMDANSAPQLDEALKEEMDGITKLTIDLKNTRNGVVHDPDAGIHG